MSRLSVLVIVVVLGACGSEDETVRGPTYTYVVDGFTLPASNTEARELGCDLNGDGRNDNQLGMTIVTQAAEGNITPYVADLLGSLVLDSRVVVQANDLEHEHVAGVRYVGHDGAPSLQLVGSFEAGVFTTDPDRRGAGVVRLPVFVDADVSQIQANAMQISLVPDGIGGFDARVCGAVIEAEAREDAARAMIQMVRNNPADHPYVISLFDGDRDGEISVSEVTMNSLFTALLAGDVTIDGQRSVSLGFLAHLTPCHDGACPSPAAPTNPCHDRVLGGNESDVDCGGSSCRPCAGGRACRTPEDCASNACDAGLCREPTCSDGAWDGFESDIDCGWNCPDCTVGQMCERATDCVSNACTFEEVCK